MGRLLVTVPGPWPAQCVGGVEPGWHTHCVFGGPLHWIGKRFPCAPS